jgi:mRNA interferase RelE/StbE
VIEYNLVFKASAAKEFRDLPAEIKRRIETALDTLRENPRSVGVVKLQNEDIYRIRVGDYRVVYQINDSAKLIVVTRVRHRREVYR